jgi:hypothetical protein
LTINSYAADVAYDLLSGDSTKTVYVWFKDAAGNVSTTASDSIFLDTEAPTNSAISINSDASTTNSVSVTLNLSANDSINIYAYYASETSTTPDSSDSGWTNVTATTSYAADVAYDLLSGDSTKTVYVWFKDAAGNVSTTASDSIFLDTEAPTNSAISINSDASTTNSVSVTLNLSADDNHGVYAYYASETITIPAADASGWIQVLSNTNYFGDVSFNLSRGDEDKTVYVWFKDAAGNVSNGASDSIILTNDISAFSFTASANNALSSDITANISETTITAIVPFGTDVTALVATFTTTGDSVTVNSTEQVSGTTANDFSNTVTYTVTAADSTTQDYTVTVSVPSSKPIISNPSPAISATVSEGGSGQILGVSVSYATSCVIYYDDDNTSIDYFQSGNISGGYCQATIPYVSDQMTNNGTNYWYVEATNSYGTTRYPTSGNLLFQVNPNIIYYTLSVSKSDSGTVTSSPSGISCGSDCSEDFPDGTSVTLTASPSTGYKFLSWSGACSGTSCKAHMTSNKSVMVTFTEAGTLAAPTGISATDGTYTDKVRVSWSSVSGADRYYVYRATSSGGSYSSLGYVTGTYTYKDDTSAVPGTIYYYSVKTYDNGLYSSYSSYNSGWRSYSAPSRPTGISATDGTYTDKVRVSWSSVSGADRYYVYRATSSGGSYSSLGYVTGTYTYKDDTSAVPGTIYYYSVKTYDNGLYSSYGYRNSGYRKKAIKTSTITTTKRGYSTSTNWTWTSSNMKVGFNDNVAPLNDIASRAFAWFDIPYAVRIGDISEVTLKVTVSDLSKWNSLLHYINLYDMGSITWNDNERDYSALYGVNYRDYEGRSSTLTFTMPSSALQGKSEIGFSFTSSPNIPTLTFGDDTHEITLNNPTLIIEYTD